MIKTKSFIPIIGSLFIVLILFSSVTAVPQKQAEIVNDQIEKNAKLTSFINLIENTKKTEESSFAYMSFLLNIADEFIDQINTNPESVELTETMVYDSIPDEDETFSQKIVSTHALETLDSLKQTVSQIKYNDADTQPLDIPFLTTLIDLLISFIKNYLSGGDDTTDDGDENGNDWISKLKEILSVFGSILAFIIKGILKGISLLLVVVLRIIGALITIVFLMLAGLQTVLTVGAFFLVFMGFISKIGLKAFSIIASPIIALLAAQFTMSMGTLIGGISMALHAVLAFALFFAIPLLIIVGVIMLTSDGSDEEKGSNIPFDFSDLDFDGPLYMLLSVFLNILKN